MYREAGTGGHAKSTVDGKSAAMKHFTTYLLSKGIVYSECSEDDLCNESSFRQFGTYLIDKALTDNGRQLMRDTAQQYFSGVVNTLKTLYRKNDIFNQNATWNTEVRTDIAKLITRRCIANGTEVEDKSKGVGRLTMIEIGRSLLEVGDVKSIETRAILNTSYHAVGRGGEVALLCWTNLYWNFNEELLAGSWNQQKTTDIQQMTFFADYKNFEICEYHSLACYLVVGGGSRNLNQRVSSGGQTWVFPCLADVSATKAVSNMLKELSKTVEILSSDVTATDLRVGSVNDIINAEGNCVICYICDCRYQICPTAHHYQVRGLK